MAVALVSKPNVTSVFWEHFGFQPNEKGEPANINEAFCKICGKTVQVSPMSCHLIVVGEFACPQ